MYFHVLKIYFLDMKIVFGKTFHLYFLEFPKKFSKYLHFFLGKKSRNRKNEYICPRFWEKSELYEAHLQCHFGLLFL